MAEAIRQIGAPLDALSGLEERARHQGYRKDQGRRARSARL